MNGSHIGQLTSQPIVSSPGGAPATPSKEPTDASFRNLFNDLLEKANEPHVEANNTVNQFITGETDNVHDVVLSMVNADMSFRLFLEMGNKVMEAYQEISRMQV